MTSIPNIDVKDENDVTESQLTEYLSKLYDVGTISDDEFKMWNDAYSYKGFSRKQVIKELMKKVPDVRVAQQIILVCGLLGPQRASLVKLMNGKTVNSYGIPASGVKGSSGISCQRITAATADLCAHFLRKVNTPKRLNLPCPAWLQFPSAGSISLPQDLRTMHIDFSKRFSTLIGGVFNEQIYEQMMLNSYLDEGLHLFDDYKSSVSEPAQTVILPVPAPTFAPNRGSVGPPKTSQSQRVKGNQNL